MDYELEQILQLLAKFENKEASETELNELDKWYQSFDQHPKFTTNLTTEQQVNARENLLNKINAQLDSQLASKHTIIPIKRISIWPKVAVAAAILVFLSLTGYFYWQKVKVPVLVAINEKRDIAPGSNKAILTLANGTQVILTGAHNGLLATQGSIVINKSADGEVVYQPGAVTNKVAYNTMSTPRGGQYKLTLADGTSVWLNSASSIRYPTQFNGHERVVEVTGEAYFEVAHNASKPFRVQSGLQTIQVLGTHFNINAYDDEPAVKTTLVEGSVSIISGLENTLIRPGEQAIFAQHQFKVVQVDTEDEIAWKNGMFRFTDESLESIMRKVSRWYDVDVQYEYNEARQLPLTGIVTHFTNVSKVLHMLELTRQVHFKIAGKKIIVIK